jgi:hypothetical protein
MLIVYRVKILAGAPDVCMWQYFIVLLWLADKEFVVKADLISSCDCCYCGCCGCYIRNLQNKNQSFCCHLRGRMQNGWMGSLGGGCHYTCGVICHQERHHNLSKCNQEQMEELRRVKEGGRFP